MESQLLILTFLSLDDGSIAFELSGASERILLTYNLTDARFSFDGHHPLSEVLIRNQFQLAKIVKSALKGKPVPGRRIQCLFIDDFTFLNEKDYHRFIRVDRRGSAPAIRISAEETSGICKLYTDGSYSGELNRSGYAGLIVNSTGETEVFRAAFRGGSSNLMELQAVTAGLERLGPVEKIQINTDSRFVIRGLAQWIHFWRLNDWQMAYGRKIRYAAQWQQLDSLSQGKLLELKWIKGHSGENNQELCHRLARQMATENTPTTIR
jgi:ribonuclease HI